MILGLIGADLGLIIIAWSGADEGEIYNSHYLWLLYEGCRHFEVWLIRSQS